MLFSGEQASSKRGLTHCFSECFHGQQAGYHRSKMFMKKNQKRFFVSWAQLLLLVANVEHAGKRENTCVSDNMSSFAMAFTLPVNKNTIFYFFLFSSASTLDSSTCHWITSTIQYQQRNNRLQYVAMLRWVGQNTQNGQFHLRRESWRWKCEHTKFSPSLWDSFL